MSLAVVIRVRNTAREMHPQQERDRVHLQISKNQEEVSDTQRHVRTSETSRFLKDLTVYADEKRKDCCISGHDCKQNPNRNASLLAKS